VTSRFEYRCSDCGSLNVLCQSWIYPNDLTIGDECGGHDWCEDCDSATTIECLEIFEPPLTISEPSY